MTVTLTLSLDPQQASRILQILAADETNRGNILEEQDALADEKSGGSSAPESQFGHLLSAWTPAQQFRELLRGRTEQLVRFVVEKGPEFFNDDLAKKLDFENPAFTSSVLGKITGKLRREGVRAEGHKHTNWYTTHKVNGKTLIRVRPDVLAFFKEAMRADPE